MKMFKKGFIKITVLTLALVLCLCFTAGAEITAEWRTLYTEDFAGKTGALDASLIQENNADLSAAYNSGTLEMKTDTLLSWTMNDTSAFNTEANSKGITVVNSKHNFGAFSEPTLCKASDTGVEVYHTWKGHGGDILGKIHAIGGQDALHALTYWCTDGNKHRTNYYRFYVDPTRVVSTDNSYEISIELYIPSYEASQEYINFSYRSNTGANKTVSLKSSDAAWVTDQWFTWTFTITDADLTQKVFNYSAIDYSTVALSIPGYGSSIFNAEAYIHSLTVKNLAEEAPGFGEGNNTVLLPLTENDNYGNTRLTFDMTLPRSETLTGLLAYNSGANAMTIGVANEDELDVATLQIDSVASGQTIYAVSENSSGTKSKTQLYTGDILDKALTYELTIDWRAKTYTVTIRDGETLLVDSLGPYAINNLTSVTGNVIGRYMRISHSMYSQRLMSVLDNITFEITDDASYLACKEDLDALTLETGEGDTVSEDFLLPLIGTQNDSDITWESSNTDLISIDVATGTATVACGAEETEVTLTATASKDGVSAMREFVVTVAEHLDSQKAKADAAAIVLDVPETNIVKENFTLSTIGSEHNATITWESDWTDSISISGTTAIVSRGEFDMPVTLTATATVGSFSATKEFTLTVASLSGVYAEPGDVTETENVVGGVTTVNASVSVQYPAVEGDLSFVAISVDRATGAICDRQIDTEEITASNKYSTVTFSISGLAKPAGSEVKYYLWDENDVSFLNNAPSPIKNLTTKSKVKGIQLNWDAAVDDNNAVSYYGIYRDGVYLASADTNAYIDKTVQPGDTHTYSVMAVDTNDLTGGSAAADSDELIESMYYMNYDKKGSGEKTYMYGMTDVEFSADPARDLYAFVTRVTDASGNTCYAASTDKKSVSFKTSEAYISGSDKDLVFEVTYLDAEGPFTMTYNAIIPEGQVDSTTYARRSGASFTMTNTRQWKTLVIRVNDANLRGGQYCSGMHFQFWGNANYPNNLFIKEVKVIQADLYD